MDLDDDYKFIAIDVGFLAAFIESLGVKNERWIDYSLLKEDLNKMVDERIARKIENKYYLQDDLDGLADVAQPTTQAISHCRVQGKVKVLSFKTRLVTWDRSGRSG